MKEDAHPHNDDSQIEKLERDLYDPSKKHPQRERRRIHDKKRELEGDFKDDEYDRLINARKKYRLPTSLFKKIFLGVLVFFVATVVVFGLSLYEGKKTVSEDLIAMEILAPPFVDGGEALPLQVRVQNFNEQDLELPDLVLSYPKDSGENSEQVYLRRSLNDIGPQNRVSEDFDLTLFGQEGDTRSINATLEYRIAGSSSIFVKKANHDVIIRSTPTQVLVQAPEKIVRNQEFTMDIDVSSNSNTQINNTVMTVQYPRGFEYLRSNRQPSEGNNTWYFDTINDEPQHIEVTGRLAALEGQGQSFVIEYGKQDARNPRLMETVFNSVTRTVDVQQSFIKAGLFVNGSNEESSSIRGGNDISIVLDYKNTLDTALENPRLVVHLDGPLYDISGVRAQRGYYNSSNHTVTFDQTTTDQLGILQPGEEGDFRINLKGRDLVSSHGVLSNPELAISVDVEGTEVNGKNRRAIAVASHTLKANSDIAVVTETQHYDGPFKNSGPMPPQVNIPTTYTLVFQITNSSNKVSDATLTTFLPPYVSWKNAIAPSIERTNISFDTTTKKLTWELGDLPAGLGTEGSQPRKVSFQVTVTPSINHRGEALDLTQDVILTGTDDFTEAELSYKKRPMTTRLSGGSNAGEGADGRVQ